MIKTTQIIYFCYRLFVNLLLIGLPASFCFSQDILLNSQADVDAFDPSVTTISGSLVIETTSTTDPITNLANLSNITTIGGNLWIFDNAFLTQVDALSNITAIGDNLWIRDNAALTQIDGFSNLTSIAGDLSIQSNAIAQIDALSNITAINGDLEVAGNDLLTQINGFSNITAIGGDLLIGSNAALTQIDAFSNLTTIGGQLWISHAAFTQIDGLSNVTAIGGNLSIRFCTALTQIDGLSNLTAIGGNLRIENNAAITQIDALSNITTINSLLDIHNNAAIAQINGLSNVTAIGERLQIYNNAALTQIDGLSNLTTIGSHLYIRNNEILTQVDALSNITAIGGNLQIIDNDALTQIDGLSSLTTIGEFLRIIDNDALTQIDGLSNLTTIGEFLNISENPVLTDCCAIQSLLASPEAIEGTISIYNNPSECSSEMEILDGCELSIVVATNSPCVGADNGSIPVFLTSTSTPPYTYSWTRTEDNETGNGMSNDENFTIDSLQAGTYNLLVINMEGDTALQNNIVLEATFLEVNISAHDISCNGNSDGMAVAIINGENPPYIYNWSNSETASTITDLPPGEYFVTVADESACNSIDSIVLSEPSAITVNINEVIDESNSDHNGAVTIYVIGGTPPYFFNWTDSVNFYSNEQNLTNIAAGIYSLEVLDSLGCATNIIVEVEMVTGTEEFDLSSKIRLSPNPTQDVVFLEMDNAERKIQKVDIYNITGQHLQTIYLDNKLSRIPLNFTNYEQGIYFVSITTTDNELAFKKVIIAR